VAPISPDLVISHDDPENQTKRSEWQQSNSERNLFHRRLVVDDESACRIVAYRKRMIDVRHLFFLVPRTKKENLTSFATISRISFLEQKTTITERTSKPLSCIPRQPITLDGGRRRRRRRRKEAQWEEAPVRVCLLFVCSDFFFASLPLDLFQTHLWPQSPFPVCTG
jgi:hypothetical protein